MLCNTIPTQLMTSVKSAVHILEQLLAQSTFRYVLGVLDVKIS